MKVGIDLRSLQTGHQYRGIGELIRRLLNNLFVIVKDSDEMSFIFYKYEDKIDPLEFLDIPENINYSVRSIGVNPTQNQSFTNWQKLVRNFKTLYGNPVAGASESDVFIQFDYSLGVPKRVKSILFSHDIIPYIFWDTFFQSPWLHIKHKALRTTLRTIFHNYRFVRVMKRSLKNAKGIIAISEHTKRDLINYLRINPKKIQVIYLGVDPMPLTDEKIDESVIKRITKTFVFFVGAADPTRRPINDLVDAYNNLKAQGRDIQLVLAGENFPSAEAIPTPIVRKAVMDSSYETDIITTGYINDATKQYLFKNALAFVFPTLYEGFGIPILEGMVFNCPVITYKNSSIPEVGGKNAIYAKDWEDIASKIDMLIDLPEKERSKLIKDAKRHADQFTWSHTASQLYEQLMK